MAYNDITHYCTLTMDEHTAHTLIRISHIYLLRSGQFKMLVSPYTTDQRTHFMNSDQSMYTPWVFSHSCAHCYRENSHLI